MKKKIFFFGVLISLFIITIITYLAENKGKLSENSSKVAKVTWLKAIKGKPENKGKECFNFIMSKNYPEALRVGLEAIKNEPENGKLYMCVGESYYYLDHYNKAIEYLKLAKNYTMSENDLNISRNLEASSYNKIGDLYNRIDEPKEALLYYKKALFLYTENGYKEGESNELIKIAHFYYNIGKWRKALKLYKKSLPVSSELYKSMIYNMIAKIYYSDTSHLNKALYYTQKDIEINQQLNNYDGLAQDFVLLGDIHYLNDEWSMAKHYYKMALNLYTKIGDVKGENNVIKILHELLF